MVLDSYLKFVHIFGTPQSSLNSRAVEYFLCLSRQRITPCNRFRFGGNCVHDIQNRLKTGLKYSEDGRQLVHICNIIGLQYDISPELANPNYKLSNVKARWHFILLKDIQHPFLCCFSFSV